MKLKSLLMGAVALTTLTARPALAEDAITVQLNVYRTGPFSNSGIPLANGMRDFMALVNARGGVGGVKINYAECETGYDTKKSIECYEQGKAAGNVVYMPWSTGATLADIPHAGLDKIPVLSMAYGLSASADGTTFPWVFNPPMTYWDGTSVFVNYVAAKEGGYDKLKDKTLGLIYLDAPFGKEPIPFLQNMAAKYGFKLQLYPVPPAEMANQGALWLNIRRDKPDYLYGQSFGAMNPTMIKEAVKNSFPMDHFVSVWWAGDEDARASGMAAKGFTGISWHKVGTDFPLVADIVKEVIDKGQSLTPKDKVGSAEYMRTIYQGVMVTEAIATAQKLTGKKVINGEDMRRGLESLDITAARWKELGLDGFAAPLKLTCADHNGHQAGLLLVWDGTAWTVPGKPVASSLDDIVPLLTVAAADYAKTDGWPKRTEACDAK